MTLRRCPREIEVKALLASGHWPHACPAELRTHAAACNTCGEEILLTQAFQAARASSTAVPNLPSPGVIWWRAQLRRRNAAVERIGKPILGAHIFALAITLLIAAGFAISQARHGLNWLAWSAKWSAKSSVNWSEGWLSAITHPSTFHMETLLSLSYLKASVNLVYLIPALVMLALLSAIVLYLAAEKQ